MRENDVDSCKKSPCIKRIAYKKQCRVARVRTVAE